MPHLIWTLLLIVMVSAATALPGDRAARERLYAAVYTFVSCTVVVFAGSWVMYWIHR